MAQLQYWNGTEFVILNSAAELEYDNSQSTLESETIQTAIDELDNVDQMINYSFNGKVDKVEGKQLSTEDYTTEEKNKLAGIEPGANASTGRKTQRFVIGTSTAGWTAADCDYLCDGTDDQVEINAAITALPFAGGEIIILDGTYNITAKISLNKSNITLVSSGNSTILNRMYDSTVPEGIVQIEMNKTYCKIKDFAINGNKNSYPSTNNYGIFINSSPDNTITGNHCYANSAGVQLINCNRNMLTGNAFVYNTYGVYVSNCKNTTITSNNCNPNYQYGIYLISASDKNTITNNDCNGSANNGIYLNASKSNTITGNVCNGNAVEAGIKLFSSSNNNTVTGNSCNNNYTGVMLSTNSNNNTITGNTCNDNEIGIQLSSLSAYNSILGNNCNNNVSNGIWIGNTSSNNTITGNSCIRGTGLTTDYTDYKFTIQLSGSSNNYNLISSNNCMGKNIVSGGGVGNSIIGNKWNDSDDIKVLNDTISAKASFKNGTSTFPSGTTHTVTDAFITANTLVTVSPTGTKTQSWIVESTAGSFTITAEAAEPSSVTFDWGAVK